MRFPVTLFFAAVLIILNIHSAKAQHQHHPDSAKQPGKVMQDTLRTKHKDRKGIPMKHDMSKMNDSMGGMRQNQHPMTMIGQQDSMAGMHMAMSHSFSLNLPMSRNGSGTSWLPDASPMYGLMKHNGPWLFMFHGNVAPRYIATDISNKGARGNEKFSFPNWFMAMGQRKTGENGLFHFNAMLSLDRLTEGGDGYPLLFQTGESWEDQPLVDKQHPHDLFSELSVSYTHSLSKKTDLSLYLGYPGEPALGSAAFMHRPSALANPDAPISHHWNDGTHITFGVATLGFRYDKLKLEVSSFTGREPDEDRVAFDKPRFDSYSGRIQYNPSENWAFQVSKGWVKSPESLHPGEDVNRTIASAIYSLKIADEHFFNASALWGLNKTPGRDGENAALLEAAYRARKLEFYSRYEWVQKSNEELNLDPITYDENLFKVNALTVGLAYDVLRVGNLRLAAGSQLTAYHAAENLNSLYGKNPYSGQIFFRLYPTLMKM
jgi:hypothetical protein